MGILRSSSNQEKQAVESNVQKAKRTVNSFMGTGIHSKNRLDPETLVSLLKNYVLPVLLYGLEIVIPTGKSLMSLKHNTKKTVETKILSLPTTTAMGTLTAEAMIHKEYCPVSHW